MFAEAFLERLLPAWRGSLPERLRGPYFDELFAEIRPAVIVHLEEFLVRRWARGLPLAKRRIAAKLADELSEGSVDAALPSAVQIEAPGAFELWSHGPVGQEDWQANVDKLIEVLRAGAKAPDAPAAPHVDLSAATEEWTKRKRALANLAAMEVAETLGNGERVSDEQRAILRGYSGWGGLDLDRHAQEFPESWKKETQGLIHEYYTPSAVADAIAEAVCPLLESVATPRGTLTALEPSAGIGRFIDAFDRARCGQKPRIVWTATELSTSSARLLRLVRPDVDLEQTSFEHWLARFGADLQGEFSLVVANPPYGERGETRVEDPDPEYAGEKAAAWYFLRRGLDILAPKGIGVFLVPTGFLTGGKPSHEKLRRRVLRRHHLSWAVRLPGVVFPGVGPQLSVDVLVFRSRGGELADVDQADQFILDGRYYEEFPDHDLSPPEGEVNTWEFTGLPPMVERPECAACVVTRTAWTRRAPRRRTPLAEEDPAIAQKLAPAIRAALQVGRRVRAYRTAVAAGDPSATDARAELLADLEALAADKPTVTTLRKLAETSGAINAEALAAAILPTGRIDLPEPGHASSRYKGAPDDIVSQADTLYRDRRRLTIAELLDFHARRQGSHTRATALAALFEADWNLDGPNLDHLVPLGDYVTGDVGQRKVDLEMAAVEADAALQPQLERQRRHLERALTPATFDEIQGVSPRQGWVPIDLVARWLGDMQASPRALPIERRRGLVQLIGTSYPRLPSAELPPRTKLAIGWLNHDRGYFAPDYGPPDTKASLPPGSNAMTGALWEPKDPTDKPPIDELRRRWSVYFESDFYAWARADEARMEAIAASYNRGFRSYIAREYSQEPIPIARWGEDITLAPHQVAGARRVLAQRGGLLAFDVGVGKTFTAIAVVARARQEGWARRPIVVVPQTLLWKWKRDFERCLPDFRVVVIGSKLHVLKQGKKVKAAAAELKAGRISEAEFEARITTSKTDSGKERSAKWRSFQAGLYDVALVSYESLPRTKLRPETLDNYAEGQSAIMRSVEMSLRSVAGKDPKKLTERQKAVKEHGARGWLLDQLSSKLPPDPDVVWEELGVDLMVVDEAASYKNLHMAEPREGGNPRYMGGAGRSGSKRAWAFDVRAAVVRQKTGGAGVVLLSATPAKNSPLEFYNMIQYIDGGAWSDVGIDDPEQFIDRYCKIEPKDVVTPAFQIERRPAVVGFTNLDELRSIIYRYGEFRKALDVGIELPSPRVHRCEVELDDAQKAKYQEFVTKIENAINDGKMESVLGHLARLSLVALHPDLDEGYTWPTAEGGEATRRVSPTAAGGWLKRGWVLAEQSGKKKSSKDEILLRRFLPRPAFGSPKFRAVAQRVAAQPTCGHIIFCEPTAAHYWIKQTLVEYGIAPERIAVINAEVTSARDRFKIAKLFNGEDGEPQYDVVIANSVANEGIDLQIRTCAIHHIDITWTPADLEQRNGRGYRQGNQFTTIAIYYYLARGSMDLFRFDLIQGKAGWLDDLVAGNPATSNPAAQTDLDPDEILATLSGDPEKTRRIIAARREKDKARADAATRERLTRRLAAASRDFARLRKDPEGARPEVRAAAEAELEVLRKADPSVWPYASLIDVAKEREIFFTPPFGVPLYEGLLVSRGADAPRGANADLQTAALRDALAMSGMAPTAVPLPPVEIGKPEALSGGVYYSQVAVRPVNRASWERVSLEDLSRGIDPRSPFAAPMSAPEEAAMLDHAEELASAVDLKRLLETHFRGASDGFRETVWPRIGKRLLASAAKDTKLALPAVVSGKLALVAGPPPAGAEILPWTLAGFERAVALGRPKDVQWGDVSRASRLWWGRSFPRGVGDETEVETEVEAEVEPTQPEAATHPPASAGESEEKGDPLAVAAEFVRAMASTPEGYAGVLASLEKLSALEDPLALAANFGDPGISEFIEDYVTQERQGRRGVEYPWEFGDFVEKLTEQISEGLIVAEGEVEQLKDGTLALQGTVVRGDEESGWYVLREEPKGGVGRRAIKLLEEYDPYSERLRFENLDDAANEGAALAREHFLYRDEPGLEDDSIRDVWANFYQLVNVLSAAPAALAQAQQLLVFARELVKAPQCQGAARKEALRALKAATAHYQDAARRIREGAHGAAYANLRKTAAFISDQAHRLAESCAIGQTALGLETTIDLGNVSDAAFDEAEQRLAGETDEAEA